MKPSDKFEASMMGASMTETAINAGLMPVIMLAVSPRGGEYHDMLVMSHPDLHMGPDEIRAWFAKCAEQVISQGSITPPPPGKELR